MDRLRMFLATSCGLGLSPWAPGTFGTLGGVAIAWVLRGTEAYLLWVLLTIAVLYALGRVLGSWAEVHAGGKDPQFFVLDEVVGYLVTVAWVQGPSVLTLLMAFLFFRLFDITKPPPIRRLERAGGGDGIMLDDVMAGVYALACLTLVRLFFLEPERWSF